MSLIPHITKFYASIVGWRALIIIIILTSCSTLTEAIGISLFLPLIQEENSQDPISRTLNYILNLFGLNPSFLNILISIIMMVIARSILLYIRDIYAAYIANSIPPKIQSDFLNDIFPADYRYFESRNLGFLNNAFTVEYTTISATFQQYTNIISRLLFTVAYASIALVISPIMGILGIALVPPLAYALMIVNRRTTKASIDASEKSADLQSWSIQALQNFKYLKATMAYIPVVKQGIIASRTLASLRYRIAVLNAIATNGVAPLAIVAVAGILYYEVQFRGTMIMEAAFILFVLKRAMDQGIGVQGSYRRVLGSVGSIRVYETLKRELRANIEKNRQGSLSPNFDQPISLTGVGFSYEPDLPVLKDLNISIPSRSVVAFVGISGAGKSTLVTLLTGLLRPTEGFINMGQTCYSDLDLDQLRSSIGYVAQEGTIFNDTLENNITLWSAKSDPINLDNASSQAGVGEFLSRLPKGFNTILGESGIRVSGGQRQRISIARELFKDIKLLILDEATSAIDTAAEKEIQQNIDSLKGEKTVVIIAHRLSTIRNCDTIFVLKNGRIVEEGSYKNLYDLNGEFTRMVDLQASGETINLPKQTD